MKALDDDIVALFKKRVYDLAGCSPPSVAVHLNGKKLTDISNFEKYVDLYFKEDGEVKIYDKANTRWEVCVGVSDSGTFQ